MAEERIVLVELKPSKVHGKGVFALIDAPPCMRLCCYDGKDYDTKEYKGDHTFIVSCNQGKKLRVGFAPPRTEDGVGQFINDSCKPNFEAIRSLPAKFHTVENVRKALVDYYKKSIARMNCNWGINPSNYFDIVALRPIKQGDELFVFYGLCYWLLFEKTQGPASWQSAICQVLDEQQWVKQAELEAVQSIALEFIMEQEKLREQIKSGQFDDSMMTVKAHPLKQT
jgi:hypothetical protein